MQKKQLNILPFGKAWLGSIGKAWLGIMAMALTVCFTACDSDDDPAVEPGTSTNGRILFSTTVTNPAGDSGSGYLLAVGK